MTDKPILFSGPMVRALLAGTKTQTRRVVKGTPNDWAPIAPQVFSPTVVDRREEEQPGADTYGAGNEDGSDWVRCPYGKPGQRLWVRETWARDDEDGQVMYRADLGREMCADAWEQGCLEGVPRYKWRPSIHMPRTACRLVLTLESVRVERLNDISEADALAEGVTPKRGPGCSGRLMEAFNGFSFRPAASAYADLWEQINGPESWSANPWVWVLKFFCRPYLQPNVRAEPETTA